MMECMAWAVTPQKKCSRKAKYIFIGEGNTIGRCAHHAYEWLAGSNNKPGWVQEVVVVKAK